MARYPARVVYHSEELDNFLEKFNHKFNKWISDMETVLKENMIAGDLIKKERIPNHYIQRYGVKNLYHYTHPEFYRSCYTVVEGRVWILDLNSHRDYNKILGYK